VAEIASRLKSRLGAHPNVELIEISFRGFVVWENRHYCPELDWESKSWKHDVENEPVLVFRGSYEEALFLTSFLQGSDIPATMLTPPKRGGIPWHSIYVPQTYVPDAMLLIEDFEKNGKKTSP
jgi:hypothetical protein